VFSPSDDERLDTPRRWLPTIRGGALLRAAAVAALLSLAAGVLLLDDAPPVATPSSLGVSPVPVTASSGPVAPPGTVGLPLRLRDAGVVSVIHAGQRVDVLAGADQGQVAEVLATGVLVLRAIARGDAPEDGALLYLAVTAEQAARLAAIRTETRITVTVRSP
jgi:hypothetical protein